MSVKTIAFITSVVFVACLPLRAADIVTAVLDGGGGRSTNGALVHLASLGGMGGIATQSVVTAKTGYLGQLYDLKALQLSAATVTVDENGTRQVTAALLMDDDTTLAAAGGFAWSITAGPASVNSAGLVSGQPVYQATPATVQASAGSEVGTLNLTVLNTLPDNFGAYAGDGLDDAWQVQYFGQPPNALAGPLIDPDGDGQTNAFEYTAGLIPTDANSVFRLRIEAVPAQPGQKRLIFSPRLTDRTYTVKAKPSLLTGAFTPLGSSTFSDNAQERTVTDLSATGANKFYQVEITKP